ncbi:hypothetical protein R3P38DRAFT_2852129 [Favolaschia claudopus]|uniref:DUF6697 domain-containing protein n=1 Tax=Favolaschia claudopus TaxID=2862362 RepID=A0AAW0DPT7_9AGAR
MHGLTAGQKDAKSNNTDNTMPLKVEETVIVPDVKREVKIEEKYVPLTVKREVKAECKFDLSSQPVSSHSGPTTSRAKKEEREDVKLKTESVKNSESNSSPELPAETVGADDLDSVDSIPVNPPTINGPSSVKQEPEEVQLPLQPATQEQQRFVMEAVVVPTLASLGIKGRPATGRVVSSKRVGTKRGRDIAEEGSSQQPVKKIKKLERSEGLAAGTLQAHLDIRDVSVRRDFMRLHYGGNSQAAFPAIAQEWYTKTGHQYFMYPNLIQNPDSPRIPGAPGLFMAAIGRPAKESTVEWTSHTYKVLTRLGTNDNLYMGEYIIRPADSLTKEEWTAQTPAMRNRWCKKLAKKDWGTITRTRIALRRRFGREPTFEEVDESIAANQKYREINATDISQGFHHGEERLAVWTMKCVGYDEQFQRDLVRQINGWTPSASPQRRKTKKSKAKCDVEPVRNSGSSKRKTKFLRQRASSPESEDESDVDE